MRYIVVKGSQPVINQRDFIIFLVCSFPSHQKNVRQLTFPRATHLYHRPLTSLVNTEV